MIAPYINVKEHRQKSVSIRFLSLRDAQSMASFASALTFCSSVSSCSAISEKGSALPNAW